MQVLIVDDHQDSRELLARYLTRRDYDVATAGDLRTAIDFLNKRQFDAIIADIALPDGTGYALISEVQKRGIRALNIAVSGYPYPSDVDEPGVTGFHYHLAKPVDCDQLCSLLEKGGASEGLAPNHIPAVLYRRVALIGEQAQALEKQVKTHSFVPSLPKSRPDLS